MDISQYNSHSEIEAGIIKFYITSIFDKFIRSLDVNYKQIVEIVCESELGQEIVSNVNKWEQYEHELIELQQHSGETEEYKKRANDFYHALPGFPDFPQSKVEVAKGTLREMISDEVLSTLPQQMDHAIERMSNVLSKEQQMTVLRVGHILSSERLDEANKAVNGAIQEYNEGNYDNWVNKDRYYDYFSLFRQLTTLTMLHIQARERGFKGTIPVPIPIGWHIPDGIIPTPKSEVQAFIPNEHGLIQLPVIQRKAAICTYIVCTQLGLVDRFADVAQIVCTNFCFIRTPHPKLVSFEKELDKCKSGDINVAETPPNATDLIQMITPLLRELKKKF
ncbi:MAG TPA: hypothetical protein VEC36_03345 [Patescibacteria group bacterium]|nr:hypothetical protein [Patescibacteria group bacterium]